ncbi:putative mitotic spindle biogenesis protein Spc19 [Xylariaceae sp. FL0016]|nr:putative mitotic spindle biogenesis protein Spc19 [Xylariaceae sp. FL0016]
MASSNQASYTDCVASLRTSLSFLESSVETLGNGISDYPRLISVLKTTRHYELIPQPTLAAAEASLRHEIGPAITLLLDRADTHIARADRRVDGLRARSELQQGRLDSISTLSSSASASAAQKQKGNLGGGRGGGGKSLDSSGKLKARVLRQKKEALKYSVERLELEVLQKERELKKRLDSAA